MTLDRRTAVFAGRVGLINRKPGMTEQERSDAIDALYVEFSDVAEALKR